MKSADFIDFAMKVGLVVVQSQGKHQFRAKNADTLDFITIPSSPSGSRSFRNFKVAARRLASTGFGNIAAHGGRHV
jgi:hypothetical protein